MIQELYQKLLEAMDPDSELGRRVSSSITSSVLNRMALFGQSSVQTMLETEKTTKISEVKQKIYKVLRSVEDKEIIPIFEKECFRNRK